MPSITRYFHTKLECLRLAYLNFDSPHISSTAPRQLILHVQGPHTAVAEPANLDQTHMRRQTKHTEINGCRHTRVQKHWYACSSALVYACVCIDLLLLPAVVCLSTCMQPPPFFFVYLQRGVRRRNREQINGSKSQPLTLPYKEHHITTQPWLSTNIHTCSQLHVIMPVCTRTSTLAPQPNTHITALHS